MRIRIMTRLRSLLVKSGVQHHTDTIKSYAAIRLIKTITYFLRTI